MKYFLVIIILCVSCAHSQSSVKQNATDKKWKIQLDVHFSRPLPAAAARAPGAELRLGCEAIMNFTKVEKYTRNKEKVETLKVFPPEHIVQGLMRNVNVYWVREDKPMTNSSRVRILNKADTSMGAVATLLHIRNLTKADEGNYSCVIKQNTEKVQTTRLDITEDNFDVPTYASLFPESPQNLETTTAAPRVLEPICQEYVGEVCSNYLKGHFVYIPFLTTQQALEEKLKRAVQVTQYSTDISLYCEGYALPSLCYSTFPICRNPIEANDKFMKEASKLLGAPSTNSKVLLQNLTERNITQHTFDYRHNSTVLRRVCKKDCEILETELCQKEYAIAKRHPHIGLTLTLEACEDLPEEDHDCLKINIQTIMVSDDECYWENGSGFYGKISIAENGKNCIEWSQQLLVSPSYPELIGKHSYCRNPEGLEPQPWCVVDLNGKLVKQYCDIPKCAHKIWVYIVVVFLLLTLTIIGFIVCLCCKNRNKNSPSAIRDINLPNADKNIYGNSRLNSPMEMSELMAGQAPHLGNGRRGTGQLRVPQYSLSQIKFLEELGEGAFGKVYKGTIKCNGDMYVAVKALKENASQKTQQDFRREIDLISELRHENIVCIVGVALKEEPLCMLFEFMARGDLHEFLMGRAPPAGKGLPALRLLAIAQNIAAGMSYLAAHHYVHRDLAARNCLVSDDFVVKISDFGLSRDIYSSDYYRVQSKSLLPVRWMPPESILYGKFTTESDIWSYGVVLWEIYSYGLQPYYGYSNQEVIAMVRGGEQLAAPALCPPAVTDLMRECWRHAPQRRPAFDDVVVRLQRWLDAGGAEPAGAGVAGAGAAERVPLLPPHGSSSGSLHTHSLRKMSVAGSIKDDARSVCSEAPPVAPKKRLGGSCGGSLADPERRDPERRDPERRDPERRDPERRDPVATVVSLPRAGGDEI